MYLYTRYTAILRSCQSRCGTSSIPIVPYLNERWKDKSTSSVVAGGCPFKMRMYPPAFAANLSSTMRPRSISSLPIVSIPSIRSASTIAARLRAHAVPTGLGTDSKIYIYIYKYIYIYDAAVSGTAVPSFPPLSAATRCCARGRSPRLSV